MVKIPDIEDPLRAEAEALLARAPLMEAPAQSAEELLHELRVNQIELEMQNDELRRAQIVIEESRDRYVDLYEFAPIGYLTLSRDGMIAEVNLTGAALLGTERNKLINRRFARFVTIDEYEHWYRHFAKTLLHKTMQSCELALRHDDGSLFHGQLDCLHMQDNGISTIRIALTDITRRKRNEAELRIAAITFESQEGMIVTDPAGVILRVNHAFTRLTGYSEKEAVGRTPAMLKSGRQDPAFYQRMWETLKEKNYWQGEIWNMSKNGKIYAEWLTISGVTASDGRITHYVGVFSEITQDKEAEAEIHRLAYYDPLTQLPNRRLLHDRLGQAFASSSRSKRYGAVLFLDLDNFKTLNDTLGHDVGDLMLIEVAKRLNSTVREGDTISRLGGDEFVLLLEDLSDDANEAVIQAGLIGDKVQEIIATPYLLGDIEFHCTTSIGVSLFFSHDESIDDLLKHADLAMYQAKKDGRNGLRFFDPAMQSALEKYSALESNLRHALQRQQLSLYYQMQVSSTRRVIGAEALLRWAHPEQGLVAPDQFVTLAEETGLIVPIGLWVLQAACAQIREWADNPATSELQLAINVSPRQFRQPDFVEQVQQAINTNCINPARLKIELTEGLVLDNVNDTIAKMHALKACGVSFSLDDFGTGYSSLSYLKQLPLDQLKIDRSFVRDIVSDPNDAAIVQAIITLGKTFGLHVMAEGVETTEQHEFLEQHDCHFFQGYLFGKPVPIDEFNLRMLAA
jgi:diguanylate cyclase (GGDEF)-like protein/PAS domain S-box-containing protein